MRHEVFIESSGDYYERRESESGVELKTLVQEAVGQPVRRIGRFIQLALIGVGRCAQAAQLDKAAAVFLGSGRGDLEVTIEAMQTILRDGHAPKPLHFINTVSNAACYYIAQTLGLTSRSTFVCNRYFAFETMFELADVEIRAGAIRSALVGAVDSVMPPLADHRARVGLAADAALADASHWLYLSNARSERSLARVVAVRPFPDSESVLEWFESRKVSNACLAAGQSLDTDAAREWARKLGIELYDYRGELGYYDSQSGAVIGKFLRDAQAARELLHLNADPDGRYFAMWIEKLCS